MHVYNIIALALAPIQDYESMWSSNSSTYERSTLQLPKYSLDINFMYVRVSQSIIISTDFQISDKKIQGLDRALNYTIDYLINYLIDYIIII